MLERPTRQEFLRRVFGGEIRFLHRKMNYVYKPYFEIGQRFAVGVIGREQTITISGPPEEEFAPRTIIDWETSNVFVDTSASADGQVLAMQQVVAIGQPLSVLRSLVDHINFQNSSEEWAVAVNPMTRHEEFWSIARKNKGGIQELDLNFVTPNIWGAKEATEVALKSLQKNNNAQEVEVRLKNADGKLEPESDIIKESVEYISKGGGTLKLKGPGGKVLYSSDSEESVVTETPENDVPVHTAERSGIRQLIERLFK